MNTKKTTTFVSLGDICMDIYDDEGRVCPGGTALNVAVAATRAGARASLISAIGTDEFAEKIREVCRKYDIDTAHLQTIEGETSSIRITRDRVEKYPVFSGWSMGALREFRFTPEIELFLSTQDIARAVLFTEIEQTFKKFCDMSLPETLKAADFSGASLYSTTTNVINSYISGLDVIIKSIESRDTDSQEVLQLAAKNHPEKLFILLRGKEGSSVLHEEEAYHQPSTPIDVVDTNGAGDAYVGTFLVVYSQTQDVSKAMKQAARVASDTITHLGAI